MINKLNKIKFNIKMAWQRAIKGYSNDMCWGMCYWFGDTFPKMIRNLRDMKHGAPELEFEEFDNFPLKWIEEESKILLKQKKEKDYEEELDLWGKEKYFDRWWFVLSRIAYCLEQANDEVTEIKNEYEEEYHKQVFGYDSDKKSFKEWWEVAEYDENGEPKLWKLITKEPDKELEEKYRQRSEEIAKYRDEMKNEAFSLISKYFFDLWD